MTKGDALLNRYLHELGRIPLMSTAEENAGAPPANASDRLNLTLWWPPSDLHVLLSSESFESFATWDTKPIFYAQWQTRLETLSGFAQRKLRLQLVPSQAAGTKEPTLCANGDMRSRLQKKGN